MKKRYVVPETEIIVLQNEGLLETATPGVSNKGYDLNSGIDAKRGFIGDGFGDNGDGGRSSHGSPWAD